MEAVICLSLMSLLFLGAMTLIITASRGTVRTQAQVYSTADAANAIQRVIGQLREASAFALPTTSAAGVAEVAWNPMGRTPLTQFSTSLNGQTINTAVEIITPPTLTPAQNGYTAPVQTLRVLSTAGSYWSVTPYNVQLPGSVAASAVTLIYRGDPDGTPDADPTGNPKPNAGTYLWQYALPSPPAATVFDPVAHPPTALCKSVSSAPNAVQFVRPCYAQGAPEQAQLEVKVISSYYSPINSHVTSEESAGASSSQLSGKCVFMRDHLTASIPPDPNTGTRTGNNVFQYH